MRAVLCKAYGPPASLVVEDAPDPVPGPGEIVVAVEAAALNFFDTLIIQNRYQLRPALPFSPGAEAAGTVVAAGAGVARLPPGTRVVGYTQWNACRERVVAPEAAFVAVPDGVSAEVAACLVVTHGTTLHALRDRAGLQPGESLAILGASGGVGQAAIEIGKRMGARVIACASSPDKLAFCRQMGADEVVDYTTEDLKQRLRDLTGGAGADVVYDAVGGPYTEPALRSTAWGGRFLVIGFAAGDIPKIPLNLVLLRGCDIRGVFWGDSVVREPERHQANLTELLGWARDDRLRPHIDDVVPLEGTAAALERIAGRAVKGKIVVRP